MRSGTTLGKGCQGHCGPSVLGPEDCQQIHSTQEHQDPLESPSFVPSTGRSQVPGSGFQAGCQKETFVSGRQRCPFTFTAQAGSPSPSQVVPTKIQLQFPQRKGNQKLPSDGNLIPKVARSRLTGWSSLPWHPRGLNRWRKGSCS